MFTGIESTCSKLVSPDVYLKNNLTSFKTYKPSIFITSLDESNDPKVLLITSLDESNDSKVLVRLMSSLMILWVRSGCLEKRFMVVETTLRAPLPGCVWMFEVRLGYEVEDAIFRTTKTTNGVAIAFFTCGEGDEKMLMSSSRSVAMGTSEVHGCRWIFVHITCSL